MNKVNFLFGVQCRQPSPLISALEKHPRVRATLHYSGDLFNWLRKNQPEFIDRLRRLARRRQIEILSSGYYGPVLSIIPDEDKMGQIEKMNNFIREEFGNAPRGIWMSERVWEPSLPRPIARAGIEYTLLDDFHFGLVGITEDKLNGYYVTEEEGEVLNIFPISGKLRGMVQNGPPDRVIDHLRELAGAESAAAAACFGSFEFEEERLEELFSKLEESSAFLNCMTFSEYIDEYPPRGRVYLPSSSPEETMRRSGGYFRNFFIKHPEANNLHKRMLQVSGRLSSLRKGRNLFGTREKDEHLQKALDYLYRAQGSVADWHSRGQRESAYSNLIGSEMEMEKFSRRGNAFVDIGVNDLNRDGKDELTLTNNMLNLFFAPGSGGALFELDYRPKRSNLLNSFSDQRPRFSLMDHFFRPNADLEAFSSGSAFEAGDFSDGEYSFLPKRGTGEIGVALSRDGEVENIPVRVEKSVSLLAGQSIVNMEYRVTNLGESRDEFWFGIEFNFSLRDETPGAQEKDVRGFKVVDVQSGYDVSLDLSRPALLWRCLQKSDDGLFQGKAAVPSWKFGLDPGQSWELKIILRVEE